MPKKAIVVFAEGFEEIEAIAQVDILRRASVQAEMVGLDSAEVLGAHGIAVKMDRVLADAEDADAIVLPGGLPGAENLGKSAKLGRVLQEMNAKGRLIAAICAAPACALAAHLPLAGKKATCYPGFEDRLGPGVQYAVQDVVRDGNVMTSRGPGTAMRLAIELVRALAGDEQAEALAKGTLLER